MDRHFGKQLVERERVRHADHYHNYRHVKGPRGAYGGDDEVGGRESMRVRYNYGYERKVFNENLNPLKSFLCHRVGKNWDKIHSEIKTAVDVRSVIGAHIFEHLYDYVAVQTRVGEKGQVEVFRSYKGWHHISEAWQPYYVCPKSGMLRITNKASKRTQQRQREIERENAKKAVHRVIDDHNHLHKIDDVWYHVVRAPVPDGRFDYTMPTGTVRTAPVFKCGSYGKVVYKAWDELNEQEKQQHGRFTPTVTAYDVLTHERVAAHRGRRVTNSGGGWRTSYNEPVGFYAVSKQTASHKVLKKAGLAT